MKMRLALRLPMGKWQAVDTELYQLEDLVKAESRAAQENGAMSCWKTTGDANWLELGPSVVDVLGLAVLPRGLPEAIDLPDDPA